MARLQSSFAAPADAALGAADDLADAIVARIAQTQVINEDRLAESIASKIDAKLRAESTP